MARQPRPSQSEVDPRAALDAAEIPWKKKREGSVGTPEEVEALFTQLFEQAGDAERQTGIRAHRIGTAANRLYALWGEAVAGAPSFKALLEQKLELSELVVSTVYLYMRLADATTEEDAALFGITRSLIGVNLLPHAKVATLAALTKVDLPVVDPRTKKPARFPASRKLLERALLEYRLAQPDEETTPRRLQLELRSHQRAIEETLEKHPELAELRPTAFIYDGVVKLRLAAFTTAQAAAVATLTRRIRPSR